MNNKKSNKYQLTEKDAQCFLSAIWLLRPLAYPVTLLALRLSLTANIVTLLGGLMWVVSAFTTIIAGLIFESNEAAGLWFIGSSAVLWFAGCIFDVADGGVARVRNEISTSGAYLDLLFHFIFNPVMLLCIGIFLYLISENYFFLFLGVTTVVTNWGCTQAASKWTVCELVSKRRIYVESLSPEDLRSLFFDASDVSQDARLKVGAKAILRQLVHEFFFQGLFLFLPLAVFLDILLLRAAPPFLFLKGLFCLYSITLFISFPFRAKREYETLKAAEERGLFN